MSNNIYNCHICHCKFETSRKLLNHIRKEHGLYSEEYYLQYIDNRNTCIDCNKPVKYVGLDYGYAKRCKSCNNIHQHKMLTPEQKELRFAHCKIPKPNSGRKKGSKNSVPYVRTKPSVTNPYWLHSKETNEKRKQTWANKTDEEICEMMNKQIITATKNNTLEKMGKFSYKGKYVPTNIQKYIGDFNNIYYRSNWELCVMNWCDENKDVISWSSEEIVIDYINKIDKRKHHYIVDFLINFANETTYLVEIKPEYQTQKPKKTKNKNDNQLLHETNTFETNQSKWKAARQYADKQGWKFVIWTEKSLKSLGIKLITKK